MQRSAVQCRRRRDLRSTACAARPFPWAAAGSTLSLTPLRPPAARCLDAAVALGSLLRACISPLPPFLPHLRSPLHNRYAIMRDYMPTRGDLGRDMMFRSCTIQVNLDFDSEADMVEKMRIGMALQVGVRQSRDGLGWASRA